MVFIFQSCLEAPSNHFHLSSWSLFCLLYWCNFIAFENVFNIASARYHEMPEFVPIKFHKELIQCAPSNRWWKRNLLVSPVKIGQGVSQENSITKNLRLSYNLALFTLSANYLARKHERLEQNLRKSVDSCQILSRSHSSLIPEYYHWRCILYSSSISWKFYRLDTNWNHSDRSSVSGKCLEMDNQTEIPLFKLLGLEVPWGQGLESKITCVGALFCMAEFWLVPTAVRICSTDR